MRVEPPSELLRRLKIGREECFQRVLTSLILDAPYPRWNSRSTPCSEGFQFLEQLFIRSFDESWPGHSVVFVDERELEPRVDSEKGGAPDWSVLWPDHIWLIELKTERGSHRANQVPYYFELAHHHFPDREVLLTKSHRADADAWFPTRASRPLCPPAMERNRGPDW